MSVSPPAFPTTWDYRRVSEIIVAIYACMLGLTFMLVPATLAAPHYQAFGGPEGAWLLGLAMLIAFAGHSFGLWLNGTALRLSRGIRIVACSFHALVTIFFAALFFEVGIYWGVIANVVIGAHIYLALHRAFDP